MRTEDRGQRTENRGQLTFSYYITAAGDFPLLHGLHQVLDLQHGHKHKHKCPINCLRRRQVPHEVVLHDGFFDQSLTPKILLKHVNLDVMTKCDALTGDSLFLGESEAGRGWPGALGVRDGVEEVIILGHERCGLLQHTLPVNMNIMSLPSKNL